MTQTSDENANKALVEKTSVNTQRPGRFTNGQKASFDRFLQLTRCATGSERVRALLFKGRPHLDPDVKRCVIYLPNPTNSRALKTTERVY